MSSESEILLQYEEAKSRLESLTEDYNTIFAIANPTSATGRFWRRGF